MVPRPGSFSFVEHVKGLFSQRSCISLGQIDIDPRGTAGFTEGSQTGGGAAYNSLLRVWS